MIYPLFDSFVYCVVHYIDHFQKYWDARIWYKDTCEEGDSQKNWRYEGAIGQHWKRWRVVEVDQLEWERWTWIRLFSRSVNICIYEAWWLLHDTHFEKKNSGEMAFPHLFRRLRYRMLFFGFGLETFKSKNHAPFSPFLGKDFWTSLISSAPSQLYWLHQSYTRCNTWKISLQI